MKWYLAKLVYRITCGDGEHTAQFDEQLRLIAANSSDKAFEKASTIGLSEEETFLNQKQQLVRWQFINVSELFCLTEMIDGAEVYSRIKEVDNATAYATFVHQRAAFIQEKNAYQLLNLI
jgi:hypothetical protein